jgi:uncharacterized membrane protein YeaQ/YmgE (transglycosylase-associated protein family)
MISLQCLITAIAFRSLGLYRAGEPAGFIGSVIGAIILLLLYRLIVETARGLTPRC